MRTFRTTNHPTVSEAVALLAASGENRPLSGGMTLLPTMKMRLASPTAIVDLAAMPGLAGDHRRRRQRHHRRDDDACRGRGFG